MELFILLDVPTSKCTVTELPSPGQQAGAACRAVVSSAKQTNNSRANFRSKHVRTTAEHRQTLSRGLQFTIREHI